MRELDNYCNYVDVFLGNGEVDHFPEEGLASKWFYIKAITGNTIPHATLPFGKMSVGAFSGGYPCGYGTHYPNCSGGIKKLSKEQLIRGFSHLHHSGVGGICYYFNYAVTTPFYGQIKNIENFFRIENENARPGYYSAVMNGIIAEFTVSGMTAIHRYKFSEENGRLAVDFSNDGLHKRFKEWYRGIVSDAEIILKDNIVYFSGNLSGIKLYFCVKAKAENTKISLFNSGEPLSCASLHEKKLENTFGAVWDFDGKEIELRVSYSTISFEKAEWELSEIENKTFDELSDRAYETWNSYLSSIEIETEDGELKKRFYSYFYHSIVKPCDMTGENVRGVKNDIVTGIATFWDQYKTLFPLIYMLYPNMSEKLVAAIINISKTLGKVPCAFDLTTVSNCEEQAKMLAAYCLCDAYYCGVKNATTEAIDEYMKRELQREDFSRFIQDGTFDIYTHITDVTDACRDVAAITQDSGFREELLKLAENWSKAYDSDGLMSQKSEYYEGDRYTYSFRLLSNMDKRIKLAGGNEKFVEMLDSFFGFNGESVKQLTYIGAYKDISETNYHRFEGFNNECDMETPYAYIYAGRNDRTCEIVHAAVTQSYLSGPGGLPGNNDSGGLSSCYIWNVLGIFPAAGQGELLIGSPHINRAVIKLSSGNTLEIIVKRKNKNGYITESAFFNGEQLTDFRIKIGRILKGGKLEINIK